MIGLASWELALTANAVIAFAYYLIAWSILAPIAPCASPLRLGHRR